MSGLRRLIVDTDTGSDDVWAIIEALRAVDTARVEAITTVCGNLPLDLCVKNAMLAEDAAGTYLPPVYRGMERPILRKTAFYAWDVHGRDGLGGMDLPRPNRPAAEGHAVQAIIDIVTGSPGEIEIVTCGPLTNLAMALLLEPRLAENIKKVWVLGGSAGSAGNMTLMAEFNVYADPEAASIVLNAGMDTTWVTWDASRGGAELTPAELDWLRDCGDPAAAFCARCVRDLRAYQRKRHGRDALGVIDSVLMTAALYPEVMEDVFQARCAVETAPGPYRGHFRIDREGGTPNCTVCPKVDGALYKKRLFWLLFLERKSNQKGL